MKRVPSFSSRPGFPNGLRVLLLDIDLRAKQEAETQLKECGYLVTCCSSSAEAAAFLSNPEKSFDVLLADVKILSQKTSENSALVAASRTLPLILTSDTSEHNEVMLGIKLGAVDFLEKPLSLLKLRNIWQHTVRKMLQQIPFSSRQAAEDTPAVDSADCEQACDDAFCKADIGHTEFYDASLQQLLNSPDTVASDASFDTTIVEQVAAEYLEEERAPKRRSIELVCDNALSATVPAPFVGFPAGQLAPLPSVPGIVWGLPSTPLQIQCKFPVMPTVPFPMPPMPGVPPPFSPMMFGSIMPPMMPPLNNAIATLPCSSMPAVPVMPVVPPAVPAAVVQAPSPPCSNIRDESLSNTVSYCSASSDLKRCDSMDMFDMEESKVPQPLLGLHLKKSASLVDMITESLFASSGSAAS